MMWSCCFQRLTIHVDRQPLTRKRVGHGKPAERFFVVRAIHGEVIG